jgi:hypothetical protein
MGTAIGACSLGIPPFVAGGPPCGGLDQGRERYAVPFAPVSNGRAPAEEIASNRAQDGDDGVRVYLASPPRVLALMVSTTTTAIQNIPSTSPDRNAPSTSYPPDCLSTCLPTSQVVNLPQDG